MAIEYLNKEKKHIYFTIQNYVEFLNNLKKQALLTKEKNLTK